MIHPEALATVRALRDRGHRAYVTGGCVRDLALRVYPSDYDLATSASAVEIVALFGGASPARKRAARVGLSADDTIEVDVIPMDDPPWIPAGAWRAQARTGDLDGDFARAFDYTVNALLYDPVDDALYDHVDGLRDLETRTLRAVGDPLRQLARNRTAVVRGVTLAERRGLTMEPATREAMRQNADAVAGARPFQRSEAMIKVLASGASARIASTLRALGVLEHALPPKLARRFEEGSTAMAHLRALDAMPKRAMPYAALGAVLLLDAVMGATPAARDRTLTSLAARVPLSPARWNEAREALHAFDRARRGRAVSLKGPAKRALAVLLAVDETARGGDP
ncbi:MAG: hypothetical protein U0326_33585 [Polyangiales bacterium]